MPETVETALQELIRAAFVESGRRGGLARAANLSPERRREIASKAGKAGAAARAWARRERAPSEDVESAEVVG